MVLAHSGYPYMVVVAIIYYEWAFSDWCTLKAIFFFFTLQEPGYTLFDPAFKGMTL